MPSLPKVGRHAQRKLVEERQRAKDSLLDKPCVTGGQWKPPSFYCLGPLSGDAKTYITCFVLFLFMAVIQYIYGAQAHSAALKADSISMGGDSISYFGNLIAELWDGPQKRNIEFIAGGASSLLLLGWTIDFTVQAITRINEARRGNCGPAVDGTIVMWFAVSNLVFDFASLAVYVYVSKLPKSKKALPKSSLSDEGSDGGDMVCNLPTEREDQKVQIRSWAIPGANMRSAMLHVLADTARSMVTFVEALILLSGDSSVCSSEVDGIATLVICILIVIGCAVAFRALFLEIMAEDNSSDDVDPSSQKLSVISAPFNVSHTGSSTHLRSLVNVAQKGPPQTTPAANGTSQDEETAEIELSHKPEVKPDAGLGHVANHKRVPSPPSSFTC